MPATATNSTSLPPRLVGTDLNPHIHKDSRVSTEIEQCSECGLRWGRMEGGDGQAPTQHRMYWALFRGLCSLRFLIPWRDFQGGEYLECVPIFLQPTLPLIDK